MQDCPGTKFFANTADTSGDTPAPGESDTSAPLESDSGVDTRRISLAPYQPPSEEWRWASFTWGGNVLRGKLVSIDSPDFNSLTVTLEDIDLSGTAFADAAPNPQTSPEGDSP